MKIAIDIRNIGRQKTGSEVVVLHMTKYLLQIDQENTYFLLTDTDDNKILTEIRERLDLADKTNALVVSLRAKNKFMWAAHTAPVWIRANKPDIYHTEYIVPFFVPRTTKLVTHIHDVSFKPYRSMISKKDIFFLDILIPWTLRRADQIISVSDFTTSEIVKYYPFASDKITTIYNAVGENFLQRATQEEMTTAIMKYSLPEKFIFSLGTMQPRKNIPLLVAAFAKIAHKIPQSHLVLSGKRGHNFDATIDQIIRETPLIAERIHFTGFIDDQDLPAVYAAAHVFAFPSLYEGFGIPLLEAFSQETPVIASDTPIFREITDDGAVLSDPHSVDQFSNSLYDVCIAQNVREDLIRAGRERLCVYNWHKTAEDVLKLYMK